MPIATPAVAVVRPRVALPDGGDSQLLDEALTDVAMRFSTGLVRITGQVGSGKSTAVAHLAAMFAHDDHLVFLDEPSPGELEQCSDNVLVVAATPHSGGQGLELKLQPWGCDELIEYLLAKHPHACASVINRLGAAANWAWAPQIARIVLDRFAADDSLQSPNDALVSHLQECLLKAKQWSAATQLCFTILTGRSQSIETAVKRIAKANCPHDVRKLLRHEIVQVPLAADYLSSRISAGYYGELSWRLPAKLVEAVGRQSPAKQAVTIQLRKLLNKQRIKEAAPMAASILLVADPAWRPERGRAPWNFSGGLFPEAPWPEVDLSAAQLSDCQFNDANLAGARLDGANAARAVFDGADLRSASLLSTNASGASFRAARLCHAKLANARLNDADFTSADMSEAALMTADLCGADLTSAILPGADLTKAILTGATLDDAGLIGATLRHAMLSGVDLRTARLEDACFENAILVGVQMEDVRLPRAQLHNAQLRGAYLTGSVLPEADLRGADLSGAGLAEIEWEGANLSGADLRNATFHMGSSRSGLVGSPIACEGSKTGFYTDDLEDMTFKRPEEVRKASLRGADLRGVNCNGVDFYLVDLRDAKLDPSLRDRARQTGAILEDAST